MMDDLAHELAALREDITPDWSDTRSERLFAGVGQLRARRRARRVALVAAGAVGMSALAYVQLAPATGPSPASVRIDGADSNAFAVRSSTSDVQGAAMPAASKRLRAHQHMQLADGSRIEVATVDGELAVERNEPQHIELRLGAGMARFDVVPNKQRTFVVAAGSIEVGVVGTVFEVEREVGRVRVGVSQGKVRVRVGNDVNFVSAGQSLWFDQPAAIEGNAASRAAAKSRAPRNRHLATAETPRAAWRSLGQSGDYEGAYRLLSQGTTVEDDSEALMDAADAARLSGHAEAAVVYLRKVLRDHRAAPVAPLAAFTLGRVLLERLGQPLEAADAFASAQAIAPNGSLAQDALAREVEAWSKAGHPDEAFQRAHRYVEKYPDGRRLRAVQLYGGLPTP